MAAVVTDISFVPELGGSGVRYLHGNMFYKVAMSATIEVHTFAIASTDAAILFAAPGFPDTSYIVDDNGGGFFKDFRDGDTILVQSAGANNGTYTNILKIDDNTIRVNTSLTSATSLTAQIYLAQSYPTVDYYYNLIENNDAINFNALVDGSIQKFSANGVVSTSVPMTANGFKSWQIGTATVTHVSTSATFKSIFIIDQDLYINPFLLPSDDANTYPTYFANNNCLKHVFRADFKINNTDTYRIQTVEFDEEVGNTGWFDENYNTGITNYSISNLVFTRLSDSEVIPSLQLSDVITTQVTFDIDNTVDSPFVSSGTAKFIANFINIPVDTDDFSNTSTLLDFNFSFDRCQAVIDSGSVNGDFSRAIQNFAVAYVSASKVSVAFDINLSTDVYNRIASFTEQKYLLAISTQNEALQSESSDGVTLLIDANDFYVDLGLTGLVTRPEYGMIEHPFQDKADALPSSEGMQEDELVAWSRIKFDLATTSYSVSFKSVECYVIAKNGSDEFVLSNQSAEFINATIVNGLEYINTTIPIPFKAPSGELITEMKVLRDIPADANPVYYYDIYYPFLNRWEYWIAKAGVNAAFFDNAEPNNGLSENWQRYDNIVGWDIKHRIIVNVTVNGIDQSYSFENAFDDFDYDNNSNWDNEDIKTYDSSNNLLSSGGNDYIESFENTKVIAEFEYVGATPPTLADVGIVLRLEPYENGGQYISTRISSFRSIGTDSQWLSTDGSGKVVVSKIGNTFYGEALINYNLMQNFNSFSITARIYDLRANENCILLEDGFEVLLENDDCILLEEL